MLRRPKRKTKVLFIGHDRNLTILQGGALRIFEGYDVAAADSADWGKQLYSSERFDVVVLGSGLAVQERRLLADDIAQRSPETKVVMLPEAALDELPKFIRNLLSKP